jgi:hypothetical protein
MSMIRHEAPAASTNAREPLQEVYRRLVAIHVTLAEATDADHEARRWSVGKIMSLLEYIESVDSGNTAR